MNRSTDSLFERPHKQFTLYFRLTLNDLMSLLDVHLHDTVNTYKIINKATNVSLLLYFHELQRRKNFYLCVDTHVYRVVT